MNLRLSGLRNALEPIIHLIAQKLLDAQTRVAAADALANAVPDAGGAEDLDDICDRLSPPVGALTNRRRAFAATNPDEHWRLALAVDHTDE